MLKFLMILVSNYYVISRFIGYENLEVVNPEGGKDDAEEEAQRGRWKQEVCISAELSY